MKRWLHVFAWALLLSAGALAHLVSLGTVNPSVEPDLGQVQEAIGPIQLGEIYEVDPLDLGALPPTTLLFQQLRTSTGGEGRMYIAYFERGLRWSGYPHAVDVCFRSLGWEDLAARTLQTSSGARLSLHDFDREGEQVRVLHWQQRPSLVPGSENASALLGRLRTVDGLRQDVASIYFEFPLADAPSDAELIEAAESLIQTLDTLWASS